MERSDDQHVSEFVTRYMPLSWSDSASALTVELVREDIGKAALQLRDNVLKHPQGDALLAAFHPIHGGSRQSKFPGELRERHFPALTAQKCPELFFQTVTHIWTVPDSSFHLWNVNFTTFRIWDKE